MDIFRNDGHLSGEAILALIQGEELDELTRLEMAEHLSFCDACLQRYTEALESAPLLTPQQSCRDRIWGRLRRRTVRILTSRYAAAAAAVAVALTLVWADIPLPKAAAQERPALTTTIEQWSGSFQTMMQNFDQLFEGLGPGDGGNTK